MINLTDIRVTFAKGTPLETEALRGVDLFVPEGEFVSVIGSNGAGKSTVLNVIAGVAPVDKGKVSIDGLDITAWPTHKRARLVSRVFQDPKMGTCEDLTIMENFALAAGRTNPRGFRFAIDRNLRKYAREKLSNLDLGLENRLNDKVGLLSGGQRQALGLLMATTGENRILLLDEHTAALDPKTAEFIMELTDSIISKLKVTTLMVTHSMSQALKHGERTIMFHQGKIVFDVTGEERDKLTVVDLLNLFKQTQGEELSDDSLLLG